MEETLSRIIEVFKTNLTDAGEAKRLMNALLLQYPNCSIHFDLDDCDKVLRMEGTEIKTDEVISISSLLGYVVSVLPD